ncbi:MAG: DUF177 domain-containing protein [Mariprofundaceae bacterium]|nr:DUF177 domain-containing protein [Mariprofundaceae bacterium]
MSGAEEQVVYQQLIFRLQELSPQGRQWNLEIPEGLFGDAGFGEVDAPASLCKGVQWKGNVIAQGDFFGLQGKWSTELVRHCVRCNSEFALYMEGDCSRHFQLGVEPDADDAVECDSVAPPGSVNLLDLLREELWLAWKPMVVCSEACKGLCQQCGGNLNRHECKCSQHGSDHPFAALKNIRFNS